MAASGTRRRRDIGWQRAEHFLCAGSKAYRKQLQVHSTQLLFEGQWVLCGLLELHSQLHQILNHLKTMLQQIALQQKVQLHLMKPFLMVLRALRNQWKKKARRNLLKKSNLLAPPCLQCFHCKNEADGITCLFFGQDKKVFKGNIEGNFLFIFLAKTNKFKKMGP